MTRDAFPKEIGRRCRAVQAKQKQEEIKEQGSHAKEHLEMWGKTMSIPWGKEKTPFANMAELTKGKSPTWRMRLYEKLIWTKIK